MLYGAWEGVEVNRDIAVGQECKDLCFLSTKLFTLIQTWGLPCVEIELVSKLLINGHQQSLSSCGKSESNLGPSTLCFIIKSCGFIQSRSDSYLLTLPN